MAFDADRVSLYDGSNLLDIVGAGDSASGIKGITVFGSIGGATVAPILVGASGNLLVTLTAGSDPIGSVVVSALPSIPAGSNTIGNVKITDAGGTNVVGITSLGTTRLLKTDLVTLGGAELYAGVGDGAGSPDYSGLFMYGIQDPAGTPLARVLRLNSSGELLVDIGATINTDGAALLPNSLQVLVASDGADPQGLMVDGSGNLKVSQQGTITATVSGTVAVSAVPAIKFDASQNVVTLSDPSTPANKVAVGGSGELSIKILSGQTVPVTDNGSSLTVDIAGIKDSAANDFIFGRRGSAVPSPIFAPMLLTEDKRVATITAETPNVVQHGGTTYVAANQRGLLIGGLESNTGRILKMDSSGRPDVTVTSTVALTPGTAAANLGKAEDAAHASGDVGVMGLGVRADDNVTDLTSNDGDYSPHATDQLGRAKVNLGWTTYSASLATTGEGAHQNCSKAPVKYFSIYVKGNGAVTYTVTLIGSLTDTAGEGTVLATYTQANDKTLVAVSSATPVLYFWAHVTTLSAGSVTVVILAMN